MKYVPDVNNIGVPAVKRRSRRFSVSPLGTPPGLMVVSEETTMTMGLIVITLLLNHPLLLVFKSHPSSSLLCTRDNDCYS